MPVDVGNVSHEWWQNGMPALPFVCGVLENRLAVSHLSPVAPSALEDSGNEEQLKAPQRVPYRISFLQLSAEKRRDWVWGVQHDERGHDLDIPVDAFKDGLCNVGLAIRNGLQLTQCVLLRRCQPVHRAVKWTTCTATVAQCVTNPFAFLLWGTREWLPSKIIISGQNINICAV